MRKGEGMKLSNYEKESIILFNEGEKTASFYTHNEAWQRRLLGLCRERPGEAELVEDNGTGGLTFEVPKKWLKVTPPRVLSPAQKRVLEEMNKKRGGDRE